MTLTWVLLFVCGWLAASVSGAAGFGGALLLLPVLVFTVGGKSAVPILTIAQLLGNLSRAGFGLSTIRWRPALLFSLGAVPASLVGSRLFIEIPPAIIHRLIGSFLLVIVALRHVSRRSFKISDWLLAPAGAGIAFLSAIAGSAGPLSAAVFLSLKLPAQAYVATEAVTAVLIHTAKSLAYGRYETLAGPELARGLWLGTAMILGSWTGRKIIDRLSERTFGLLVEAMLILSATVLLISVR